MNEPTKVRLDRWLWAARFFKTRSAAKEAIDGGKVHCGGMRAKPSKEVDTLALQKLNDKIHRDARVDMALLTVGDGLTLVRRKV